MSQVRILPCQPLTKYIFSNELPLKRGLNFPKGILLEEGFSAEDITEIKNIGFKTNTGYFYNSSLIAFRE